MGSVMNVAKKRILAECPAQIAMEVLGGKWKGLIIFHVSDGTKRFCELQRLIPRVSQRMLSKHLRELEADGIVRRKVHGEVPPRVEYSLTEFGKTLNPILDALHGWGQTYLEHFNEESSEPVSQIG